ncbi:MAG: hypothetical protein ACSLEM_01510 [Candidatus Malihini olakiniferum]
MIDLLLATTINLIAVIQAVVLYNVFACWISSYKELLMSDFAAQVLLLVSYGLECGSKQVTVTV